MTADQCRAARGLLHLRADALAARAGVSLTTLRNFECSARQPLKLTVRALRAELEAAGALFVDADAEAGPGVRLQAQAAG